MRKLKLFKDPKTKILLRNVAIGILSIVLIYAFNEYRLWGERNQQYISDSMNSTLKFSSTIDSFTTFYLVRDEDLYAQVLQSQFEDGVFTGIDRRLFQHYVDNAAIYEDIYSDSQILLRGLTELEGDALKYELDVGYQLHSSSGKKLKVSEQILATLVFSLVRNNICSTEFNVCGIDNLFIGRHIQRGFFHGCRNDDIDPSWFFNTYLKTRWKCVIDNFKALDHEALKSVLAL